MNIKYLLILFSIFLSSCSTQQVYISDIDAERKSSSNSTKLERIVSDDALKDAAIGLAVILGIDQGGKNYVAIALAPTFGVSLVKIKPYDIRSLELHEAKELLNAIAFATENYEIEVEKLHSINSSYDSYLQSNSLRLQGIYLAPILTEFLSFTFVNNIYGPEAVIYFTSLNKQASGTNLQSRILDHEKLIHLSTLLNKAVNRANATSKT